MKKIKNWVKNKSAILSIALSNVEKNAFSQIGEGLGTDVQQASNINQGKISDSLINGEITQEVMNLRWRMYKIIEASDNTKAEILGYRENGQPIYNTRNIKHKIINPNLDSFDSHPIEMIVDNEDVVKSVFEGLENKIIEVNDGDSIGNISGHDYFTQSKNEKPIIMTRKIIPNFYLELFTKMLKIRKIDNSKRLLEFYVSSYPDEYNRTSRLFISSIKKEIENKSLYNSLFDIDTVSFVSNKTQGIGDNFKFEYNNLVFDKIIQHNGYYVIKIIGNVKIDGEYIMEGYREKDLDNKYINKEKK